MSVTSRTATKRVGEASIGWHNIGSLAAQVSCDSAALAAAAAIAAAANAKVSVIQLLPMPVDASAWALSMDPAISERHEQIRGEAQRQAQDIRHRLASYGVEGDITTLEATFQDPASLAALAARRADLVVTARPSGSIADATYTHALFAGLLLNSGRPVLVVPEGAKITLPIQQAVIAWTDSPEATRAMAAGLPSLSLGICLLLAFQVLDDLVQSVEACTPELAVPLDPGGLLFQPALPELAGSDAPDLFRRHQSSLLQHADVLLHVPPTRVRNRRHRSGTRGSSAPGSPHPLPVWARASDRPGWSASTQRRRTACPRERRPATSTATAPAHRDAGWER